MGGFRVHTVRNPVYKDAVVMEEAVRITHRARTRVAAVAAVAGAAALALSGCGSGGDDGGETPIASAAPSHLTGTVSLWHFFSDREAKVIQGVVDDFEKANPDVKVVVHPGQDDEKLRKAIAAGNDVDVAVSYSTDIVGNFCQSGAFQDLAQYIQRDKVDLGQLLPTVRSYTEFDGTRCAMPVLADAYGLYYNKSLLAKAGITTPPKTLDELEADAIKLTTYNADGSIKTLGFNPWMGYQEMAPAHLAPATGAQWLDENGKSLVGTDPGWKELIEWQKAFAAKIGTDKLKKFTAASADEFSAQNDFEIGRVAMNLDGEWRVAFMKDQAPKVDYGTAPFPTGSDHTDLYGGGYLTGNIGGIAKGSKNPELAWALLKYLTTDTAAVVKLANGLQNVPTITSAYESPDLVRDPQFETFLKIAQDPHSLTTPPSPNGAGYQLAFGDWWQKYQSVPGTSDLDAELKKVDDQINAAASLNSVP